LAGFGPPRLDSAGEAMNATIRPAGLSGAALQAHTRLASLPTTTHRREVRNTVQERNAAAAEASARRAIKQAGAPIQLPGSRVKGAE
jgi:hypothetical protein